MEITQYYKHLSRVQNHKGNAYQDIMTITGFMDSAEKAAHLKRYAEKAKDKAALDFLKV